jgi:hypothetical protein
MAIVVTCEACAGRFSVGEQHAGKTAKCPRCGQRLVIPKAHETTRPKPEVALPPQGQVTPKPSVQPSSGLADLLDEVKLPSVPSSGPKCPACGYPVAANAVLCVQCGYDARTGTKLAAPEPATDPAAGSEAGTAKKKKKKKSKDASAAAATYLRGCICCAVGVVIGAAIWYGVAMATGYEVGWIAWGMGALAGLGMQIGYGKDDDLSGITAALMAVLGIFLAKWLIFANILLPILDSLQQALQQELPAGEELPSKSFLFFHGMFGLIDGIFILLAFFTAYKIGSGKASDD